MLKANYLQGGFISISFFPPLWALTLKETECE